MSKRICVNCGKEVDGNVKFCPYCGANQFRQMNPVSSKSPSIPTKKASQNNDLIYKLFYWNYDGRYILSKTKVISILTFIVFVLSIFTGPPVAVILIGLIFSVFFQAQSDSPKANHKKSYSKSLSLLQDSATCHIVYIIYCSISSTHFYLLY